MSTPEWKPHMTELTWVSDAVLDVAGAVNVDNQPERTLHNFFVALVEHFQLPSDPGERVYHKDFVIDTMKQFIQISEDVAADESGVAG